MNGQRRVYLAVRRGCPRRSLDAARLLRYLLLNGWVPVATPSSADLSIVWTCGGFDHTEAQSLRTIKQAIGSNGSKGRVIAIGCLPRINPEALAGLPVELVPSDPPEELDVLIGADIPLCSVPDVGIVPDIPDLVREPGSVRIRRQLRTVEGLRDRLGRTLRHRIPLLQRSAADSRIVVGELYSLLVSRGCLSSCSYCAIKLSMGRLRSRTLSEIKSQFEVALSEGHKRFVLIGEDVGAWGVDLGLDSCDLLKGLFSIPGDHKLIINDFNALWLVRYGDDLVDIFEEYQAGIEALVVPIQSGSDRVLKLMRRRYEIADVEKVLGSLRERVPGLRICTHIIVGFPTETEEDFQASLRLLERNGFWHTDIFLYEERAMASSSKIFPKNPPGVIVRRAGVLAKTVDQYSGRNLA